MKFKKILYSAGAIGALVTPTVSIIACSKNNKKPIVKLNKNDVIVNAVTEKDVNSKLTVNGAQEASKFSKPKTVLTDSGVLVTFTWGEVNDGLGTIKWNAVLSKGNSKKKTISGTLKGFKTKEKNDEKNKVLRNPSDEKNKPLRNSFLSLSKLKSNAISEIDKIDVPDLDAAAHSATKHGLIAGAKTTAKQKINSATTIDEVASKLAAQKTLVQKAIDEYKASTGSIEALANAKKAAISEIDKIDVPDLDAAAHSATKHGLIAGAKTTAKQKINSATTIDEVASKLAAQKALVQKVIDEYKTSTGTNKVLAGKKTIAISEIDAIDVPDLDAAAHSATKHGLIAGAKTTAKQKINSATTIDEVASKLAAQKALVQKAIDEYKASTGTIEALANAKKAAISEIDKIDVPDLDAAAHSATKHGLIAGAKTTAKQKINSATTIDEVASKLAAQKALVQKVIDEYKTSTGTNKVLAGKKTIAISEIDAIDVPDLDAATYSATKHKLIAGAKTTAKQKINSATTIDEVASKLAAQKALVQKAIDEYKASTGTIEALANAKKAAISEIDKIDVPDLDAAAHSATKHKLIAGAKTTAKQEINSATTIDEVASKLATQNALVQKVIDEYKASTGTNKVLAGKKTIAISEIDAIDIPDLDAATYSATKHKLIGDAKTIAKQEINSATTIDEVASKLAAQKTLVQKAIDEYKASTGTIEALANAKNAAISEIDAIDVPDLDAAAHSATKHKLIADAKTTAKQEINSATTIDEVASKLAAQKTLVQKAIDEYKASTGTIEALANAKKAAISEIDAIDIPDLDAAAHSATKHGLIGDAKTTAKQEINSATTIDEVASKLAAQKTLVQKAIDEYKTSTGTIEALVDYKSEAINEINAISVPDLDAAAHSATKHRLIDEAKMAARQDIIAAKTSEFVSAKLVDHKNKIKNAIEEYNASTGTAKALTAAKLAAISEIDAINVPDLNGKKHSAIKHGLIFDNQFTSKQDINSATTIEQVASRLAARKAVIEKAIEEYKASTGTDVILAAEKTKAIKEINEIDIPKKEDLNYEKSLYGNIAKVKAASLAKISTLTYDQISTINQILNAEKIKINAALNEYLNSQPIVTYTQEEIMNSLIKLKNKSDIMLYLLELSGTTGKNGIASIKTDMSELQVDELININLSVSIVKGIKGQLKNGDILRLSASPKKWYKFMGTDSPITIDIEISKLNSPGAAIIDEKELIDYIKSVPVDKWGILTDGNLTNGVGSLYKTFTEDVKSELGSRFNAIPKSKSIIKGTAKKLKHGDVIRIILGYKSGNRFRISGNSDIYVDITLGKKRILTFKEKKIIDFIKNSPITNWGDLYSGSINAGTGELYVTFPDPINEELKNKFNVVFKSKKIISGNPGKLKKGDIIRIIFGDEGNNKNDLGVDITIL